MLSDGCELYVLYPTEKYELFDETEKKTSDIISILQPFINHICLLFNKYFPLEIPLSITLKSESDSESELNFTKNTKFSQNVIGQLTEMYINLIPEYEANPPLKFETPMKILFYNELSDDIINKIDESINELISRNNNIDVIYNGFSEEYPLEVIEYYLTFINHTTSYLNDEFNIKADVTLTF
jgi:hypothetical protein